MEIMAYHHNFRPKSNVLLSVWTPCELVSIGALIPAEAPAIYERNRGYDGEHVSKRRMT